MALVLTPGRCIPQDFINPFAGWWVAPVACTLVLLAAAFVLHRSRSQGARRLDPSALVVLAAGIGSLLVALWAWLQSALFLPWCIPPGTQTGWRFQMQIVDLSALPTAIQITEVVAAVVVLAAVVATAYRLMHGARPAHA